MRRHIVDFGRQARAPDRWPTDRATRELAGHAPLATLGGGGGTRWREVDGVLFVVQSWLLDA